MARPRTKSKPRPKRKPQDAADTKRFGRSSGLGVPDQKARKILAAYVAGLCFRQIAGAFNTSHHTIKAIIANRKDLLAEVEQAAREGAVPAAMLRDRTPAPKILCPPTTRDEFRGPITRDFLTDIFGYLRAADFSAQHSGIYFMFRGGKCVYVGQSKCVAARCGQHLYSGSDLPKAFDRVMYAPVAAEVMSEAERAAIRILNPEYNRQRHFVALAA